MTKYLDSFQSKGSLTVGGRTYEIYRLSALQDAGLDIARLPVSLRVLLENLLRNEDGKNVTRSDIEAASKWDPKAKPSSEIAYMPARVLLQDFTGVPCVVDLAAMRDAMVSHRRRSEQDQSAASRRPCDRSLGAGRFVRHVAAPSQENMQLEFERNRERYQFLQWGQNAFENFRVVPPGTGIVHQVNLEYLAQVVFMRRARRQDARLSRHAGRHRLAHHDDQRSGRARLGRRRHRGRGRRCSASRSAC